MAKSLTVCTTSGCPHLTAGGRCSECRAKAEQARGSAYQRGYGGRSWETSRTAVLTRDPLCVCVDDAHGHGEPCGAPSKVSDHWPDERRDLVTAGVADPDAPERMRGLCPGCHNRKTGTTRPGGWNA
jgi:5-methylcytosine-specific restriction protein A